MLVQEEKNKTLQQQLINGAVRTIATLGLENTTTNAICKTSGVNVAYIYRFFADKEDLIEKSFDAVDEELLRFILNNFPVLHYKSIDYESRCRVLFMKCWNYLMERPKELIFYVRYYYSLSFQKYAYKTHMERYAVLFQKMENAFPETSDVRLLMHHILDTLLGEATNQVTNPMDESSIAAAKCFRLIFSVVKSYVKQEKF